ncbi:hypothetical protein CASFOL_008720 [Castilleja foliolosa]|uniref:KIB1-4 beta-propeller domain-containing protein n=1 Tax=Castilleja foliolosa TaxID=1961234 RepID=A0ABD3E1T1_9LAMI
MVQMAKSIFSSSPRFVRLVSTFKSPNFRRMMSTTTTAAHGLINNPSPCLMLPPIFEGSDGGDMVYNFYNLAQNKVLKINNMYNLSQNKVFNFNIYGFMSEEVIRTVGSSHGWLALFNERNSYLVLTNPFTHRHVELPSTKSCVSKVIISCDAEQEDCQAMMIYDGQRLAFCRPGRSPTEWTPIGALTRPYEDLVYSSRHNLFICVTEAKNGDDLEAWDVASDTPILRWENREDLLGLVENQGDWLSRAEELLMDETETGLFCETLRYLVFAEQIDQLFLVTRHIVRKMAPDGSAVEELGNDSYPYKTVSFDVHEIDWELDRGGGRLSHVDGGSLDGLAMFVGLNHSFAVSATEDNGLKPNSIYFTDDKELTLPKWFDEKYGGHDIGIFDYENKTISSYFYPCDVRSVEKIMPEPIWFTPSYN